VLELEFKMVFILSKDGRDEDFPNGVKIAFERYNNYLKQNEAAFPPRAHELATSNWFYNPGDHRTPHDGRLESCQISETQELKAHRRLYSISLRLLGAYHDGHIEIIYPKVFSYSLLGSMPGEVTSHGDWGYDEFRLSERGYLIHEIEWAGAPGAQRRSFSWIIEADDIDYRWIPATS
jgi:hypothetical protein